VHLQKMLEVMPTGVYTGLNPLNFIRKHFPQIWVRKVAVHGSSSCANLRNDVDGLHSKSTYRSLSAQGLSERTVYRRCTAEITTIKIEFRALRFSPRCNRESSLWDVKLSVVKSKSIAPDSQFLAFNPFWGILPSKRAPQD
jgi:hypothetical protein